MARFPFPAMPGVNNAVVALVRVQDFVDNIIRDETGKYALESSIRISVISKAQAIQ